MKFISFTSGSCGNSCWLGDDSGGIIIDAGASMRLVGRILRDNSLSLDNLDAVLVTHNHLDHIRFLGTYCKWGKAPVFTTSKLHSALSVHPYTRDHIASCRSVLVSEQWNLVGEFKVRYFTLPHDAVETVGFAVQPPKGGLFVLMTDLEHVTEEAIALAREAETVVIESNYDREMLLCGPYSPQLRRRILEEGHLSNDACAEAISRFWHPGLKNLFLCHLSGNNNTPEKAYSSALAALECRGVKKGEVHLRVLPRGVPTPLMDL